MKKNYTYRHRRGGFSITLKENNLDTWEGNSSNSSREGKGVYSIFNDDIHCGRSRRGRPSSWGRRGG